MNNPIDSRQFVMFHMGEMDACWTLPAVMHNASWSPHKLADLYTLFERLDAKDRGATRPKTAWIQHGEQFCSLLFSRSGGDRLIVTVLGPNLGPQGSVTRYTVIRDRIERETTRPSGVAEIKIWERYQHGVNKTWDTVYSNVPRQQTYLLDGRIPCSWETLFEELRANFKHPHPKSMAEFAITTAAIETVSYMNHAYGAWCGNPRTRSLSDGDVSQLRQLTTMVGSARKSPKLQMFTAIFQLLWDVLNKATNLQEVVDDPTRDLKPFHAYYSGQVLAHARRANITIEGLESDVDFGFEGLVATLEALRENILHGTPSTSAHGTLTIREYLNRKMQLTEAAGQPVELIREFIAELPSWALDNPIAKWLPLDNPLK